MKNGFINNKEQFYYHGILYDTLFTYDSDDDLTVLVYTDNKVDSEDNIMVYVSYFHEYEDDIELVEVTNEKEFKIVNMVLSISTELFQKGFAEEEIIGFLLDLLGDS